MLGGPGPLGSQQQTPAAPTRRGTGHKTTAAFRRCGKLVTEALREIVEDTDSVRKLSAKEKPGL